MSDTHTPSGHWVFKRELTLGHLISTIMLMITVVTVVVSGSNRIAVLERIAVEHEARFARGEQSSDARWAEVLIRLHRIEDKLDRKVDR